MHNKKRCPAEPELREQQSQIGYSKYNTEKRKCQIGG